MALAGYEIVQEELRIEEAGSVAKTCSAPTGKVVVGGGFRFQGDSIADHFVTVHEDGPYAGIYGDGTKWFAHVTATGPGTLRVMAICVDA